MEDEAKSREEWLSGLKVGDEMVVKIGRVEEVHVVSEATPAFICAKGFAMRFRRSTGEKVPKVREGQVSMSIWPPGGSAE